MFYLNTNAPRGNFASIFDAVLRDGLESNTSAGIRVGKKGGMPTDRRHASHPLRGFFLQPCPARRTQLTLEEPRLPHLGGLLQSQQETLAVHASGIAGHATVGTNHAVAGDYDGNLIAAHRLAHRLRGGSRTHGPRNGAVRGGVPGRDSL